MSDATFNTICPVPDQCLSSSSFVQASETKELESQRTSQFNQHEIEVVPSESLRIGRYQPIHPFSSDFSASAASRWSFSFSQFETMQPARSTAAAGSERDTVSAEPTKVIISDDFPEHSWFEKKLGDFYAARCNLWHAFFSPPELEYRSVPEGQRTSVPETICIIPKSKGKLKYVNPNKPLPRVAGITGLSNRNGECAMNAGLQILNVTLNSMREGLAPEDRQQLEGRIQERTPQLWRFLNDGIITEADARKLKQEIAQELTKDYWYSFHSHLGIGHQSVDTGYIKGISIRSVVTVLLHQLEAPQIYFAQSLKGICSPEQTSYHCAHSLSLRVQNDEFLKAPSIQEVIRITLEKKGRLFDDPVPPTLVVNFHQVLFKGKTKSVITSESPDILKSIRVPHANGSSITYQPKALILNVYSGSSAHGFAIIKGSDEAWYEVNDAAIYSLDPWKEDLEEYIGKRNYLMIYKKIETEDTPSGLEPRVAEIAPAQPVIPDLSSSLELQKIEQFNVLFDNLSKLSVSMHYTIGIGFDAPLPDFLFNNTLIDNTLKYRWTSFFLSKKAKLVKQYNDLVKKNLVPFNLQKATTTKNPDRLSRIIESLNKQIDVYQQEHDQATSIELKHFWTRSIETLNYCRTACSRRILALEVFSTHYSAESTEKTANASKVTEAIPLYNQAIHELEKKKEFLDKLLSFSQEAYSDLPERFKGCWMIGLENIKQAIRTCSRKINKLQSVQNRLLACSDTPIIPTTSNLKDKTSHSDTAIAAREQEAEVDNPLIDFSEDDFSEDPYDEVVERLQAF